MKKLLVALLVGVSAIPAQAVVMSYTVLGVFNDGGSFSGGFDYETNSQLYSNIAVSVMGGNYSPITYTTVLAGREDSSRLELGDYFRSFYLLWNPPLGGAMSNVRPTSIELVGGSRQVIVGTVTRTAIIEPVAEVPEPAMLGLFGLGAIGLGLTRRRRTV